jgi:hypothetical protein
MVDPGRMARTGLERRRPFIFQAPFTRMIERGRPTTRSSISGLPIGNARSKGSGGPSRSRRRGRSWPDGQDRAPSPNAAGELSPYSVAL